MRWSVGCVLVAALLTAGCDRRSPGAGQGDAPAPDEATAPAAPASAAGTIDRSHRGTAAPAFTFQDAGGKTTSLAAFRGKPVLVNLWATWCGPCVRELPTLDKLAAARAGSLQVVALSQDMDAKTVAPFVAARHLAALHPYTDETMQWLPAVTANLPTTILYDASGHEVWRTLGDLDWTGDKARAALAEAKG